MAAPAAIPDSPKTIPKAAELIGRVSTIPIITATMIPMRKGWYVVPYSIDLPISSINLLMGGPITNPIKLPNSMENAGVNNRSSFVLPEIKIPNSTATKDAVKAPRGSPGPINKTP